MVHIDSERIHFIPPDERWEPPYDDNTHRPGRDEFYVLTIARTCNNEDCDEEVCSEHGSRDRSSVRITRNFETQTFILYVDGESIVEAQWADTQSGKGPNGHKKVLKQVELFAKGWMAAEEEVPVRDIHVHSHGPEQ